MLASPPRSGQVQLRIVWEVTARSLLTIKLHALERVLAQRREILAALQPVPPTLARQWAQPPKDGASDGSGGAGGVAAGGIMGAGVSLFGVDSALGISGEETAEAAGRECWDTCAAGHHAASLASRSWPPPPSPMPGAGWAVKPSRVAAEVLARHAHGHNRRHLAVTVLEARGLTPRRGVVMALSASELPSPAVQLRLASQPDRWFTTPALEHTLQPQWDGSKRYVFSRVDPAEAALVVRLCDARGGLRQSLRPLGEATLHCGHITDGNPVYAWVPLGSARRRRREEAPDPDRDELYELQVGWVAGAWAHRRRRASRAHTAAAHTPSVRTLPACPPRRSTCACSGRPTSFAAAACAWRWTWQAHP